MKKLLNGMLIVALAATMVGCGSSNQEASANKDETVTLTVATSADYPPYESLTTDGEIVGFDIDMAKLFEQYLTEQEGKTYKLEIRNMSFDNIVTQIQGDQVDLGISGFTYDEKRKVEWSDPYLGTAQVALVPKNSSIKSIDELEGKSLAAQTGSTGEKAANEVKGAKVTSIANVQDIMTGLGSNQFDAVVLDSGVAKNYVNSGQFVMLDGTLLDEKNYIIAKEGNTELIEKINKCIEKFIASDDYKELCEKYELVGLE